jgi:FKBP-type peptidyl-prolyl cis-trans isomerase
VTEGKKVTITYKVRLLDGTLCYSSDKEGPKTFIAGHGSVEAGLEQGILMMRQGDKARLILPPFLAWGVPGDRNKIPPRSVIVYELEVTAVQ